ncbi:MAG: CHAT domain-containing protein [Deltaproteobacteria bacterium]
MLAALTAACPRDKKPEGAIFSTVELDGCAYVALDGACLLTKTATVVLWTDTLDEALTVGVDDAPREVTWKRVQGGLQGRVVLAPSAKSLVLAGASRWEKPVRRFEEPKWLAAVRAAIRTGAFEEARAKLDAAPQKDAKDRAFAKVERAAIAWREKAANTATLRLEAAEAARAAGLLSLEVDQTIAAAFAQFLTETNPVDARRQLRRARERSDRDYPRGGFVADMIEGQIALSVSDRRTASRVFSRMTDASERLGADALRFSTLILEALNHLAMGSFDDAIRGFEAAGTTPHTECEDAMRLESVGWAKLMARENGLSVDATTLDAELSRALELHSTRCRDVGLRLHDLLNLALFALQENEIDRAAEHLQAARDDGVAQFAAQHMWHLELSGRVALAADRASDAAHIYVELIELANRAASPDGRWRAQTGLARSRAAAGQHDAAARGYAEAERILDSQSLAIALEDDRGSFLASRARASRDHVALLQRIGRSEEAVATIRRARVRLLAQIDRAARLDQLSEPERDRWWTILGRVQSTRSELDATVAKAWALSGRRLEAQNAKRRALERRIERDLDEALSVLGDTGATRLPSDSKALIVGYHLSDDGWLGYVIDGAATNLHRLGQIDPTASKSNLAAKLIEPFRSALHEHREIHFLATGSVEEIDLHALEFDGSPLFSTHVITYALDLPERPTSALSRAVVVGDPTGNLPSARAEAKLVADELLSTGVDVTQLSSDRATASRLRETLGATHHFHYSGHARSDARSGWKSAMLLANDDTFAPGDLLALPAVPSTVFLSGCATGEAARRAVLGLGLAQAFVLAGARQVIATTRPIDDRTAHEVARLVYEHGIDDLAASLAHAQRTLAKEQPHLDAAAFRVFGP